MTKVPPLVDGLWRYGAWPGLMVGSLLVVGPLRALGVGPTNAVFLVTTGVGLLLLLAQVLAGRTRPGRDAIGTDLLHMGLSNAVVTAGFKALFFGALYWLSERIASPFGGALWPADLPLPAQVGLAMLVGELCFTTVHLLAHRVSWMWPWHAVHHSSPVLYVLSAGRSHPVNTLVSYAAKLFPAILLGAHGEVLVLLGLFTTVLGMLQHADLGLRTGWLGWIFATPEVHRIHHSTDPVEGNSNFGGNLVLFDHLFGTFLPPVTRPAEVGLSDVQVPGGYWKQLAVPLRWRRLGSTPPG